MAVDLFYDALRTAEVIDGVKKVSRFLKAGEAEALFDLHSIPSSARPLLWRKMRVLESVWNETRRTKKAPPRTTTKKGGRRLG